MGIQKVFTTLNIVNKLHRWSIMETCSVVLTFESVEEILWCDHLNETSPAVLLHGTICFSIFYKTKKLKFFLNFDF